MNIYIKKVETISPAFIEVSAEVRYWDDAIVDGVRDEGGTIPLRVGAFWSPVIELSTGKVRNWPEGVTAQVHYKVCDQGEYWLQDENGKRIAKWKGCYVPDAILCQSVNGFGDYIIMFIDSDGQIENWRRPSLIGDEWEEA